MSSNICYDTEDTEILNLIELNKSIQTLYNSLMEHMITKQIRPVLNPLKRDKIKEEGLNTNKIYFALSPDQNVKNYYYRMFSRTLGWTNTNMTSFYVISKTTHRGTKSLKQRDMILIPYNNDSIQLRIRQDQNADAVNQLYLYNNIISKISNNSNQSVYMTDVKFNELFKFLNFLRDDIILDLSNKKVKTIHKLLTGVLISHMKNLNITLGNCNLNSYAELIAIMNSLDSTKTKSILRLLSVLKYKKWESYNVPAVNNTLLNEEEMQYFVEELGTTFLNRFFSNSLILKLLEEKMGELIILVSYIYSLLKMLYIVFGFYLENTDYIELFKSMFPNIVMLMNNNNNNNVIMNCTTEQTTYENNLTIKQMLCTFYTYSKTEQINSIQTQITEIDIDNEIRKTFGELLLI